MTDGTGARDQEALVRALLAARERGDAALTAEAARQLPRGQRFGAHPGQLPALLRAEYDKATDPLSRCGLAAALARAWVYGGYPERSRDFAGEALRLSAAVADPAATVDALDAMLLASWGPDALSERLRLAARIEEAAAYLDDPEARLSAHLWRLTTAWECLDVVGVQRQLRALDTLAQETGSSRAAFFAASRRAMHALVTAELAVADELIAKAREAGAASGEPDLVAVTHSLSAARARRAGDQAALRAEAAAFADYGTAEGVPSVSAEAAVLWLEGGAPDRAREVLLQLAGGGLAAVPRDVDFLLTTASLVQVAAVLCGRGHDDEGGALVALITAEGAELLAPYAGRAVLNAGAVTFHGVVDDYLFRAHAALFDRRARGLPAGTMGAVAGTGTPVETDEATIVASWRDRAAACYRRVGAAWWLARLPAGSDEKAAAAAWAGAASGREQAPGAGPGRQRTAHLRRDGSGCTVGFDQATFSLPDLKGLRYLSELLARPAADIAAADLAAVGAGHAGTVVAGADGGEIADAQALAAYRQRLRDLDAELAEARSWADEGRAARLGLEREALLGELGAAAGLGGRPRRFSSADERARIAVRKAIAAALTRIEARDPAFARLLRDTVRTGAHCRYDPDPARPVSWVLRALPRRWVRSPRADNSNRRPVGAVEGRRVQRQGPCCGGAGREETRRAVRSTRPFGIILFLIVPKAGGSRGR
ncbi:MAG TPA: hypothetical protein VN714_07270 [Trebonia sp.]|nr:hypothetical protein [Trebonia sp.]